MNPAKQVFGIARESDIVSVRDVLALAGARQSDLTAILQALEDDRIGHEGEEDACGPFTELNPAILGQPPYGLNVKRCNIVQKAIKHAQGWCVTRPASFSVLVV